MKKLLNSYLIVVTVSKKYDIPFRAGHASSLSAVERIIANVHALTGQGVRTPERISDLTGFPLQFVIWVMQTEFNYNEPSPKPEPVKPKPARGQPSSSSLEKKLEPKSQTNIPGLLQAEVVLTQSWQTGWPVRISDSELPPAVFDFKQPDPKEIEARLRAKGYWPPLHIPKSDPKEGYKPEEIRDFNKEIVFRCLNIGSPGLLADDVIYILGLKDSKLIEIARRSVSLPEEKCYVAKAGKERIRLADACKLYEAVDTGKEPETGLSSRGIVYLMGNRQEVSDRIIRAMRILTGDASISKPYRGN